MVRKCPVCGEALAAEKRSDARYCSTTCKSRALWLTRRELLAAGRAALAN